MAVSIDTVYQKVLALANKEQRGYITPQEFNLMADKSQIEIFNNYFHDLKTAYHKPTKTDMTYGDEMEMIVEKLQPFRDTNVVTISEVDGAYSNLLTLPTSTPTYMINHLRRTEGEVTEVDSKDILYTESNPLTKATKSRSVYVRLNSTTLKVYPTPTEQTSYTLDYYRIPKTPVWDYVVINGRALFNNTGSGQDFELHVSEEENLVSRILQMSGVAIQRPDLQQAGAVDKQTTFQDQNN
tara:strand:+ start:1142 stop:1861 length:720 start_codon:yes stop_codon:yes gene_type:complete